MYFPAHSNKLTVYTGIIFCLKNKGPFHYFIKNGYNFYHLCKVNYMEKNVFLVLAMEQINDERKTITKI